MLQFRDHFALDAKDVRKTNDGYVVATPRVARTGIQLYAGREVGRPDLSVVRVYRDESEVFNKDSLATFAFKPLTDDHPSKPVTADSWKKHAVGQFGGEVARDGEFVRVPMTMMDAGAIRKFEAGKAELSVGYTCDLKWESGTTKDGQAYDCRQTDIRVNHIALVKDARGGRKLRIGDEKSPLLLSDGDALAVEPLLDWYAVDIKSPDAETTVNDRQPKENAMTEKSLKSIMVDGISVSMGDQDAQIVLRSLEAKDAQIKSLNEKIAKMTADAAKRDEEEKEEEEKKKKELEAKDAQIAALNQKLADAVITPEKLNALVADRAATVGKAKVVLGDKAPKDLETQDAGAIKKLVVTTKLGDQAKDWSEDAVNAAFITLTSDVKPVASMPNGVHDTASALSRQVPTFDREAAQKAYDKRISDAWKNPAGLPQQ